jgi:hypothetical protein
MGSTLQFYYNLKELGKEKLADRVKKPLTFQKYYATINLYLIPIS